MGFSLDFRDLFFLYGVEEKETKLGEVPRAHGNAIML
jgi:hypothetical protein